MAALLRQESANRRAEVEELRVLQPPAADAATVDSVLSMVGAETVLIDRWAKATTTSTPKQSDGSRFASA